MDSIGEFPVYAVLPASDFSRARSWYEEKLGLTPSEEAPGNAWYRCADGTWFILTQTPNAGTAQNTAAGFTVKESDVTEKGNPTGGALLSPNLPPCPRWTTRRIGRKAGCGRSF